MAAIKVCACEHIQLYVNIPTPKVVMHGPPARMGNIETSMITAVGNIMVILKYHSKLFVITQKHRIYEYYH